MPRAAIFAIVLFAILAAGALALSFVNTEVPPGRIEQPVANAS